MTTARHVRTAGCAVSLAAIAAAALFLRFWRLRWALDDGLIFPDEIVWYVRVSQQQKKVVAWITAQPGTVPGTSVATPARGAEYFFLTPFLSRAGLRPVMMADGEWLRAPADVLVVPDLLAIGSRRDHPDGAAARDLARLEADEGGFRQAARWPMAYMNDPSIGREGRKSRERPTSGVLSPFAPPCAK